MSGLRWARDDAEQHIDGHANPDLQPSVEMLRAMWSMPTSRRFPPFPQRARMLSRKGSRSLSARLSASLVRSPARQD
jgi:hypothetical protein